MGGVSYHGDRLLLQGRGVDDAAQQASVSDGVLLPLKAFVLKLAVDQQQLTLQSLELLPLGGA